MPNKRKTKSFAKIFSILITVADILKKSNTITLNGRALYRRGEEDPYIQYGRKDFATKKHITTPYNRAFHPSQLYLHPYFPHLDVLAIQCQYDGLFMKRHQVVEAKQIQGATWFIIKPKRFALNINDVYQHPEYFKPIYTRR